MGDVQDGKAGALAAAIQRARREQARSVREQAQRRGVESEAGESGRQDAGLETQAARVAHVAALIAGDEPAAPADAHDDEDSTPDREADASGMEDSGGGEDAGEHVEAEEEGQAQGKEDAPAITTIDDVAKALGVSRAELNATVVEVGSEKMTLGELKAKLPELVRLDKDRAEYDRQRDEFDLSRADHARRIAAIVESFPPGSVPAAVMSRLEEQHAQTLQREALLLAEARPEWSDAVYREAQVKALGEFGRRYGFRPVEIQSIADHRMILFAQDYMRLAAKVAEQTAAAKRVHPATDKRLHAETAPRNDSSSARARAPRGAGLATRVADLIAQSQTRGKR